MTADPVPADPVPADPLPADGSSSHATPGHGLVRAAWIATAVLAAVCALGLTSSAGRVVAAVVSGALFLVGCGAFLWAYGIAVGRSRTEAIGVGGLFFLAGEIAPRAVRRSFLWALVVQMTLAIAAGVARPYTPLAFATLAPMSALGLAGLWGARHGRFSARPAAVPRAVRRARATEDGPEVAEPGTVASAHEPPDMEQNVPHG
jgi:hypothetical protein